jgi:methyl-accepting chemotaxis protein
MMELSSEGQAAVSASVSAMERIADRVALIHASAGELGERVRDIVGFLAILDDLSDQTNLLALNAGIEAARAGAHGSGFAVVAAEVRKLAERARESTSQVQALVAEIVGHMEQTTAASDQGAREAADGTAQALGAAERFASIVHHISGTAPQMRQISVATAQQRSAADQTVVAMRRLADVAQTSATGSRQTLSAADDLASLAGAVLKADTT